MSTLEKIPLPFNPDILKWARERLAISQEEASEKVKVKIQQVKDWENGKATPTVRQGRILADFYKRHFLEFFSTTIPFVKTVELVPDYRPLAGQRKSKKDKIALQEIQAWAESIRANALDLIDEIGEQPPVLSDNLMFNINDNVEEVAVTMREATSFPIDKQITLPANSKHKLPNIISDKIESMGIIVLKDSTITRLAVRGMCLFTSPLPVIIYGNESPSAQAFTLMHEFGHVLLGKSGISGEPESGSSPQSQKNIEDWCNRFAAAFLIPQNTLKENMEKPSSPLADFDRNILRTLANKFSVSQHAMLVRLVNLNYVDPNFYWKIMRPIFVQEEKDYKGGGRTPYYGTRYINRHGRYYTSLVLEALNNQYITLHNAAEYMGIKNLQHLSDIHENFHS